MSPLGAFSLVEFLEPGPIETGTVRVYNPFTVRICYPQPARRMTIMRTGPAVHRYLYDLVRLKGAAPCTKMSQIFFDKTGLRAFRGRY